MAEGAIEGSAALDDDCSSASSAMPTTASHVSGVTIHIPAVPVIELTLLVIAALLWRLLVAVHAGLAMLHALQAEKIPHSGVPSAEKGSPPPPPHLSRQLSRERLRGGTPVPPPSPRGEGEPNMLADARPLRISAGHFGKCLSGDADVDVALFIAACQACSHSADEVRAVASAPPPRRLPPSELLQGAGAHRALHAAVDARGDLQHEED